MKLSVIVSVALCSLGTIAFAELKEIDSERGDSRVRKALESCKVKYTVDSDNDFRVSWTVSGGRDHVVFVNSNTETYSSGEGIGDIELREIWAVGFISANISESNLRSLLERNATYKVGAWALSKQKDGRYIAKFVIQVPADCRGSVLRQFTHLVAKTADEIEKIATDKDAY